MITQVVEKSLLTHYQKGSVRVNLETSVERGIIVQGIGFTVL